MDVDTPVESRVGARTGRRDGPTVGRTLGRESPVSGGTVRPLNYGPHPYRPSLIHGVRGTGRSPS